MDDQGGPAANSHNGASDALDAHQRYTVPANPPNAADADAVSTEDGSGAGKTVKSAEMQQKLNNLKCWSVNTFKCSKQILNEKLGRTSRTVDPELERKIEVLRETQAKYSKLLSLSRAMNSHMFNLIQTQRSLGELFADLSVRTPPLLAELESSARTQRTLARQGDVLLSAIRVFSEAVDTLCNKTMQDTMLTIRQYESARVQYDAYRNEVEGQPAAGEPDDTQQLDAHKARFELLHHDVDVKMQLLDENRLKVMKRQLVLLETATAAYFSGNSQALDDVIAQFRVRVAQQTEPASFLEFN